MKGSSKQEAKRKRNNVIIGFVMIFLMVFGMLAISLTDTGSSTQRYDFNGFTFTQKVIFENQIYFSDIVKQSTKINGEEILFFFPPGSMSIVNVSSENLDYLVDSSVVLFSRMPLEENSDFNINLLFFDYLVLEFNKYSFKNTGYGISYNSLFETDFEVINCSMASSSSFVFMLSNETGSPAIIEVSPFCFELIGEGENFFYLSDYILYKVHGVI